jgi:asparagine synthase (glutamine-hydrolysing)
MTVFCGAVHRQGHGRAPGDDLYRLRASLARIPGQRVRHLESDGIAIAWRAPPPGTLAAAPSGMIGDAALTLVGEVGADGAAAQGAVVAAVAGDGRELGRLDGDFCFAAWHQASRSLILARDASGNGLPIYYHQGAEWLVFANHLPCLLALPWVPRTLDRVMAINTLTNLLSDTSRSWYGDIPRLPPAHFAIKSIDAPIRPMRWWFPEATSIQVRSNPRDYYDGLAEAFDRAVALRIPPDRAHLGIKMSGGLDSTIGAATLARALAPQGHRLLAFSHVQAEAVRRIRHPTLNFDEAPQLAAMAARYDNLDIQTVITPDDDFMAVMDRVLGLTQQPNYILTGRGWHMALHDAAAWAGCHTLFDCTRGNQTISWSGWPVMAAAMRSGRWPMVLGHVWKHSGRSPKRALQIFRDRILPALLPPGLSHALSRRHRGDPVRAWDAGWAARPDAIAETGHGTRLSAVRRHREAVDVNAARLADFGWGNDVMSEMATVARAAHGLRLVDLTADRALMEYCLTLPPDVFIGGGRTRLAAREAFRDRLPSIVIDNAKLGVQDPQWEATMVRSAPAIGSLLDRFATRATIDSLVDLKGARDSLDSLSRQSLSHAGLGPRANGNRGRRLSNALTVGRFIDWLEGGN